MVKKTNSKKSVKKPIKVSSEASFIDWKIPAAFVAGILVTVLYFNIPTIMNNAAANTTTQTIPTLFIINDENCALCDDAWVTTALSQEFNYTLERIDFSSSLGQELIDSMGITSVPAVLLSSNFVNNSAYEGLSGYLVESGDYFMLKIQGVKDLTKQASSTPKVDLFVMSQCPYGTPAQKNMINLKKTVPGFQLNMYYIVDVQSKAEFDTSLAQFKAQYDSICLNSELATSYSLTCAESEWQTYETDFVSKCELKSDNNYYCSLHGPAELNLDMVQLCAMNLSTNWGDFIISHIDSNFNTTLAANTAGINVTQLLNCANSSLGLDLLKRNIAVPNALSIGASPTYIFDNVYSNPNADSATVLCTLHPTLTGCENTSTLEIAESTGSC